jgi:hypothetical protein
MEQYVFDLSLQSIIGIILLFTNQVVGWGGLIYFTYLGKKSKKKYFYALASGAYIASWGMLGLGAFLAGEEGIAFFRQVSREYTLETTFVSVLMLCTALLAYRWKKRIQLDTTDRTENK